MAALGTWHPAPALTALLSQEPRITLIEEEGGGGRWERWKERKEDQGGNRKQKEGRGRGKGAREPEDVKRENGSGRGQVGWRLLGPCPAAT